MSFGLVLLGSIACGKRAEECDKFIGTVNRTLREIDARPQPKADDLEAVAKHRKALAAKYEALAGDVLKLPLTEPELVQRAERYSTLARAAGKALSMGVKALDERDQKAADASQARFESVAKQEAELVREINRLCLADE